MCEFELITYKSRGILAVIVGIISRPGWKSIFIFRLFFSQHATSEIKQLRIQVLGFCVQPKTQFQWLHHVRCLYKCIGTSSIRLPICIYRKLSIVFSVNTWSCSSEATEGYPTRKGSHSRLENQNKFIHTSFIASNHFKTKNEKWQK